MAPDRVLTAPLSDLLLMVAEEEASDEASSPEEDLWAGLLREGPDLVPRLAEELEQVDTGDTETVDPDEWSMLNKAVGVIVTRDNRTGTTTARAFGEEADLLAAREAIETELAPTAPGGDDVELDEDADASRARSEQDDEP
jgi:hypothetical protein